MGKAIFAMVSSCIVYLLGSVIEIENHFNAPYLGVVLAVIVMGGFIIYFNEKKK